MGLLQELPVTFVRFYTQHTAIIYQSMLQYNIDTIKKQYNSQNYKPWDY